MLLEVKKILTTYTRTSKLGLVHEYKKFKSIMILKCDNCWKVFERPLAKMSPRRRNNSHFHVCDKCDAKRFAQQKGVERRFIWDRRADSTADISKL